MRHLLPCFATGIPGWSTSYSGLEYQQNTATPDGVGTQIGSGRDPDSIHG
jgi:hypothetical protein